MVNWLTLGQTTFRFGQLSLQLAGLRFVLSMYLDKHIFLQIFGKWQMENISSLWCIVFRKFYDNENEGSFAFIAPPTPRHCWVTHKEREEGRDWLSLRGGAVPVPSRLRLRKYFKILKKTNCWEEEKTPMRTFNLEWKEKTSLYMGFIHRPTKLQYKDGQRRKICQNFFFFTEKPFNYSISSLLLDLTAARSIRSCVWSKFVQLGPGNICPSVSSANIWLV